MSDRQFDLFDVEPDPWDLDDAAEQRLVATVVFADGAPGEYDYCVPERLLDTIQAGQRLSVPLGRGNRRVTGYCVAIESKPATRRLKEVDDIVDADALLSSQMIQLTRWMTQEYLCPWGRVLETVVPAAVRGNAGTYVATFLSIPSRVAARLPQLDLPAKQAAVLSCLNASAGPVLQQHVISQVGCTSAPIKSLIGKGLIETEKRRIVRGSVDDLPLSRPRPVSLNDDQRRAVDHVVQVLRSGRNETVVLHGVTGSGKTEVYIRIVEEVVSFGRQAIILVPEISLTPQTLRRFRSRFAHVAVLHSHLSEAERNWHWQRIARGETQVVVGARSAVFAPVPQLGLIVMDEEHDGSFKQDQQVPRYHAREVAIQRAKMESIPLILGSATPSLESWYRAQTGQAKLISMPNRVLDLPLPHVSTVDLRVEFENRYTRGAISRPLVQAMTEAIDEGGQVILLLNRRGFSTHIQCPACGGVVRCSDCDIALTHHRSENLVVCHYCDYQTSAPARCPECGFEGIRYGGLGTQKLEAEVAARFPRANCLRMDSDTMRKPGSHQEALSRFRAGEVQVLLGTQMIAKGLDFPNVTLVGVINADTGLHLPDFRAAERTFQLVTQVAGRTGRGEMGGRVLVQTFSPEHYAIDTASRHDYLQFVEIEMETRQALGYPPFGAMVRVIFRGESDVRTKAVAGEFGQIVQAHWGQSQTEVRLLGPAPAPIAKLRGRFRFHILLQARDPQALKEGVRLAQEKLQVPEDVQWIADVDPLDML